MAIKVLNGLGVVLDRISDVSSPVGGSTSGDNDVTVDVSQLPVTRFIQERTPYAPDFKMETGKFSSTPSKVESQYSSEASYSTLFNTFDLRAEPFYNYYVADEASNDLEDIGDRRLADIPRYIKVSWRQAPDIAPKSQIPGWKRVRASSLYSHNLVNTNRVHGLIFDGTRLEDFSMAKNLAANGYISPGSISTIVEMPMGNSDVENSVSKVDEQKYLMDDELEGISIHDIQKALLTRESGLFAASALLKQAETQELATDREIFEGQFSLVFKDGNIEMNSVTATSPAISLNMATTLSSISTVSDFSDNIIKNSAPRISETSAFTEVTFHDTSIVGLVSEDRINLITRPEHVENVSAIGKFLPNFMMLSEFGDDVRRESVIPSVPSNLGEERTEYIGYVLEKYEQDLSGMFRLVDEIEIDDISYTEFIDTRVKYGVVYRYRIKCLLKWTRKRENLSHNWTDQFLSKNLLPYYSSYFYSDWGRRWAYATVMDMLPPDPPDEFVVRTESFRRRVVLSWKLPQNQQRDISHYLVWRKTRRDDIDLGDWELLGVLAGARNGLFFDNDVDFFDKNKIMYIYAVQTVSIHREFSMLSRQLGARLNQKFVDLGEHPLTFISEEGVHIRSRGLFSTKPAKRRFEEQIAKNQISLSARTGIHDLPFVDKTYTVRFESLDIARDFDVEILLKYDNIQPLVIEKIQTVVIRSGRSGAGSKKNIRHSAIVEGAYKSQNDSTAVESSRKVLASWDITSKK